MNEEYNKFRQKVHSKFNTSDDLIKKVIKKATKSDFKNKKKIIVGQVNEVYDVTTKVNIHFILRISRNDNRNLYLEKWAIDQAKDKGIPTPDILLVETVKDKGESLDLSVETKVEGKSLDELLKEKPSQEWLKKILFNSGEILSKIHTIKTNGFGDLDETGSSRFKNLKDSILDRKRYKHIFIEAAEKSNLNPLAIEHMFKIFVRYKNLLDNDNPVLVHNDFGPQHIMIQGEKITGILDWEVVRGGDPLQDIARWEFYYGRKLPTEFILNGYSNKEVINNDYDLKIHLFKLYKELILIYYNTSIGNKSGIEYDKQNIIKDLNYFGIKI